jgi:cell division protein FtsN
MARKQARRGSSSAGGHFASFIGGLVCGLGLALLAWMGGYLPRGDDTPPGLPSGRDEPPIIDAPGTTERDRQYDFFTVLPEMEVVVPREEIEQRARENPEQPATPAGGTYVIQVGSFRSSDDADGLKAQLALLGLIARVQEVSVDDATWYRVRLGPYETARAADQARRQLQDNGFEAMVMSGG